MTYRVLAVGDVVGATGLDYIEKNLARIKKEVGADFIVVNGENANVVGATPRQLDTILAAGADAITLGNHTWTRWELQPYLDESAVVLHTCRGVLAVRGRELRLRQLSVDGGQVAVDGTVDALLFEEPRREGGFLARLLG